MVPINAISWWSQLGVSFSTAQAQDRTLDPNQQKTALRLSCLARRFSAAAFDTARCHAMRALEEDLMARNRGWSLADDQQEIKVHSLAAENELDASNRVVYGRIFPQETLSPEPKTLLSALAELQLNHTQTLD